ncbi:hypothetical protein Egran_04745 [Elaphomyces granulatus]|uniref:Conserved oligomeric Golgi complex subunit 2 n=1 Tax=Elaphomyces granulatus TaxID=519963 RepID=A0A232LTK0_9EURO|nr:hypothetical protein Egran_04745 [Elaphomyces granulatus]
MRTPVADNTNGSNELICPFFLSDPQFGHSNHDDNDSGSDIDGNVFDLPFPKPLSRTSFLAPDFDPATFLASLTNRHQSLEDLRQELRDLSQSLNKELLDLVNQNYQAFLSLGGALRGGEEKVEEVRVGLLGFQRDVTALRAKVDARRQDVENLLGEKKQLRANANLGRMLLDILARIEELELRLLIGDVTQPPAVEESDLDLDLSDSDSDENSDIGLSNGPKPATMISLRRLEHQIQKYAYIPTVTERLGNAHPFLTSLQPRIEKIKLTLLLDLNTALDQANNAGERRDERTLKVLQLYSLIGEEPSAISALRRKK